MEPDLELELDRHENTATETSGSGKRSERRLGMNEFIAPQPSSDLTPSNVCKHNVGFVIYSQG